MPKRHLLLGLLLAGIKNPIKPNEMALGAVGGGILSTYLVDHPTESLRGVTEVVVTRL